ncbi:hypothetical protein PENTCL1PPCAC_22072, partial [Pristionchus entomophagus]
WTSENGLPSIEGAVSKSVRAISTLGTALRRWIVACCIISRVNSEQKPVHSLYRGSGSGLCQYEVEVVSSAHTLI